jgi:hypothetical protein
MDLTNHQQSVLNRIRHNYRDLLLGYGICPKCQSRQIVKGYKQCLHCRKVDRDRRQRNAKVVRNN